MLSFISWCLSGAFAGWLFGVVMQPEANRDKVRNVIVGVVGALFGGFLFHWNIAPSLLSLGSVLTAGAGAVALLAAVSLFMQPSAH